MIHNKRILITGSNGMLGSEFCSAWKDFSIYPFTKKELDITNSNQLEKVFKESKPEIFVNTAAYTKVDDCEKDDSHFQINGYSLHTISKLCVQYNCKLVHFSTDYVFSGKEFFPIQEEEPRFPVNAYGEGKLVGEKQIISTQGLDFLLFRVQWLYGSNGKNFLKTMLNLAKTRKELKVVSDQFGKPTSVEFIVKLVSIAIEKNLKGIYHLSPNGDTNWFEFAKLILEKENCKVIPIPSSEYPTPAKRPSYSVLSNEKLKREIGINHFEDWKSQLLTFLQQKLF
ncbi:MAG: dTDP-4-dehydrorhamnose reductase [Leptospiraceae bacterium]|nr:dTDP-4-dehydrorhamnose reductase [Leptospiraceae bacterium]